MLKCTTSVAFRANGTGMDWVHAERHDKITWEWSFPNGSYDTSKECLVATSAKGTMSRDAEQGTHESQFVFPCALFLYIVP